MELIIQKFNFVTNIILLTLIFAVGFVWADTNGIWTQAEDVRAGVFGGDEGGGDYIFPNNLLIEEDLVVGGNTISQSIETKSISLDGNNIQEWPQCVSSEDCYWSDTYSLDVIYQCNPGFAMTGFILKSESTFQIKCCKFGTTIMD